MMESNAVIPNMRQKQTTVQMFCEKHLENISDMFRTLYKDEELADVTLYCREGSVKAHKLILAASSPYFQKIFLENKSENLIIFMHKIGLDELKNLVDLMYKGAAEIPVDNVSAMYDYVDELQLIGVLQDESRNSNSDTSSRRNSRNRDKETRFRGMKRVPVDYNDTNPEEHYRPLTRNAERISSAERLSSSDSAKAPQADIIVDNDGPEAEEFLPPRAFDQNVVVAKKIERAMQKTTLWNKKPRKYKCELCDRSFKRASHLTRHQLVHTGERPYACNQCDKAFSRHDKLKHHIRKAHNHEEIDLYNTIAPEWTGHLQTVDPPRHLLPPPPSQQLQPSSSDDQLMVETNNPEDGSEQPLMDTAYEVEEPPPREGEESLPPVKKARGRPRKYPKALKATIRKVRNGGRISRRSQELTSVDCTSSEHFREVRKAMLDVVKNSEERKFGSVKDTMRIQLKKIDCTDRMETNQKAIPAKRKYKKRGVRSDGNSKENNRANTSITGKKRGRKPKVSTNGGNGNSKENNQGNVPVIRKKRGRKPKDQKMMETMLIQGQTTEQESTAPDPEFIDVGMQIVMEQDSVLPSTPINQLTIQFPPKKRRGRPPGPKAPPPLIKRGRGRPRIHPVQQRNEPIQPGGQPFIEPKRSASQSTVPKVEHYDFSNLPFGDIEYLTRPLRDGADERRMKDAPVADETSLHHEVVLEPVVEIKTEPEDRAPTPENIPMAIEDNIEPPPSTVIPTQPAQTSPPSSLPPETTLTRVVSSPLTPESQPTTSKASPFEKKVAETTSKLSMSVNQIAKIGECTISVANV